MTWMEMKSSAKSIIDAMSKAFAACYSVVEVNNGTAFLSKKNKYFRPFTIWTWEAVGIEYANDKGEAEKNRYEDGDLFYLEDYDSIDALMKDILQEIER